MKFRDMPLPPYIPNFAQFVPGVTQVLYSGPYWDHAELEMAMEALLTGHWITGGEYVVRFQNKFAKYFGVGHAQMVNSGSSANLVMIAAVKKHFSWQDGSEIIVSPVGFPTTIAPLVQNGLQPVFIDVEFSTLNFDVQQIEAKITPKTKAIFVSPVLGNPPDMDVLQQLCGRYKLALIGDHCDSLGSRWRGRLLNEYYAAWSASFYPAHHITTGEGGMICSDDEDLIKIAQSFATWGRDCYCSGRANLLPCGTCKKRFAKWLEGVDLVMDHKYIFTTMGYNLKPLDLQGAIGLAQLDKLPEIESKRRAHFTEISQLFSATVGVRIAATLEQASPCWFGIPIICDTSERKEHLVEHLEKNKVQTRPYFAGNLLRHPAYRHLGNAADFPNADKVMSTVFFIGCPPQYTPAVIKYIGEVVSTWTR